MSQKNTAKKHIGQLVKKYRLKNQLTQHELGAMLGVDRQYMWKIENGKINISLDYLDKIIHTMKCTHKDFFKM